MRSLTSLDISRNKISKISFYDDMRKILPGLSTLGIEGNTWDCQYLSKLKISLELQDITLIAPLRFIINASNIVGYECIVNATQPPSSQPENLFGLSLRQTAYIVGISIVSTLLTICLCKVMKPHFSRTRHRISEQRNSRRNSLNTTTMFDLL